MCFSLLSGIPAWNPPRMGKNIFLITADLKLSRLPPRSPLPFGALPSVSLPPAAPLADDTDKRRKVGPQNRIRFQVIHPWSLGGWGDYGVATKPWPVPLASV